MAVLGFRFSKLNKILGTIYKHGCTGFLGFQSSIRYWVLSINMAVLGFRFSKLNKILGTIYEHGCTGPSTAMFIDRTQYLTELGKPKTQYSHVYR
jgi:hypothetical protein